MEKIKYQLRNRLNCNIYLWNVKDLDVKCLIICFYICFLLLFSECECDQICITGWISKSQRQRKRILQINWGSLEIWSESFSIKYSRCKSVFCNRFHEIINLPLFRSHNRIDLSLPSVSVERHNAPVGSNFKDETGAVCPLNDHLQLPVINWYDILCQ